MSYRKKNLLIAIDGSLKSKHTFLQAQEFFTPKLAITIYHIYNEQKNSLPLEYQAQTIYESYEEEVQGIPSDSVRLVFENKNSSSKTIRSQMIKFIKENNIFISFFGYYGRKGPKHDESIPGTMISKLLQNSIAPTFICKNYLKRKDLPDNGFNFLVCLDGSQKAKNCLYFCKKLATHEGDKIYCLNSPSYSDTNLELIKQQFKRACHKKQIKSEFIQLDYAEDNEQQLIDFINLNGKISFHFVLFGNNGMRAQTQNKLFTGRISELLLTKINTNIIIIPKQHEHKPKKPLFSTKNKNLVIGYWGIRGRGHAIRNLAYYLGIKFEEKRYGKPEEWFAKDKIELGLDFPNLPYIIDGDIKLTESKSILKYLCVKGKLEQMLGITSMDQILIEQIMGIFNDIMISLAGLVTTTSESKSYETAFNEKIYPKLAELDSFFAKKLYIGGNQLTWMDFEACENLAFLQAASQSALKVNIFEKYKSIKNYYNGFMELPKIKQFYSKEENQLPFLFPAFMKIKF